MCALANDSHVDQKVIGFARSLVEVVAAVRAVEVSAHDVWLEVSAGEEPAGFGGEFGLIAGPEAAVFGVLKLRRSSERA